MKNPFSISCRVALILLAAFISFSTSAALQLVTTLNPSISAPANGNGDSWAPIISPDGRFVLFASTADNLVATGAGLGIPKANPPCVNVYLRDRLNQTTTLVSVNLAGTGGGNGDSFPTGLSTNGQFALFESAASDLVADDTNSGNDVFLRDVQGGSTMLVSAATNGACGNGVSRGSMMTPDGHYVAFVSTSSNLVTNDTNGIADVFVRDIQAGTTALASVGAAGSGTTNTSEAPEITPDGRYVAFYSTATGLVSGVTSRGEIYIRNLQDGTTTWASTNARAISGFGASGFCYNQAISDNGQYVAFEISPNTVSVAETNGYVLRYNSQTGLTDTIFNNAVYPSGTVPDMRSLNMTPDGRFIAFAANAPGGASCVYLWDAQTGTNTLVSGNYTNGVTPGANVFWPDVDPTGRHVVFVSTDTNMIAPGGMGTGVFLRDVQAGVTTLVSVDTNGANLPVNSAAVPALSIDGGSVAFESPWANLDGRNYESDVFTRDLTNTVSELISVHDPGLPSLTPNGPCALWPGSVSTNGRYVAFSSWASNLAPNDTNRCMDVFVHDLVTGQNVLASVGVNGFAGNYSSIEPSISGNGRYVAFTSAATNLLANDTNGTFDVFIRDLQANTTELVSVSTNGGFGNGLSHLPSISTDGRYVLFCSQAQNLAAGTYANDNLFLRDRQAGQTYGLTTNGYQSYAMTPDGSTIAFVGSIGAGSNLYVWNSSTAALVYTNASGPFTNVSISPDARWLVYVAGTSLQAQDLIAGTNFQIATGLFGSRAGLKFSDDGRFLAYAGTNDIYLYDFQSGTNLLVSHAYDSADPANGPSDSPVISADGRFVAFRSFASNCVANDSNGVPDIFLFDRLTHSNILASANSSDAAGNNRSFRPVFSSDGQMLVLQSWASDLIPQNFNLGSDLLALDVFSLAEAGSTNPPPVLNAQITLANTYNSFALGLSPLITWAFTPGQPYSVQFKDNLADPIWHTLATPVIFIGSQAYLDDTAPNSNQRFYRIMQGN